MTSSAGKALRVFGWVAATLYVGVGLLELILADNPLRHRLLFFLFLASLAAVVLVGIRMIETRPWPGVLLASVGAISGGFALFWTGLAIVLAVAIVSLGILSARRVAPAAA